MNVTTKIILSLFVLGALGFSAFSYYQANRSTLSGKPLVVTSFYPLYFFTSQLTADKVEIFSITPAGSEPHDYEPTAQQIAQIENSKMTVVNGAGFELWFEKIKDELKKKSTEVVIATEGLPLMESESKEDTEEGLTSDPHVWLDPLLAKIQVQNIKKGLIKVDPSHTKDYESKTAFLNSRLDQLDNKFKSGLTTCKQRSFVTSHAAFGYLANRYGLTQVSISGLSPESEPSAEKLAEVAKYVKVNNIKYIFFENLVSPKLSETIARETGAQTMVLDPIEGISDDNLQKGENYFTVAEKNLENLRTALECN